MTDLRVVLELEDGAGPVPCGRLLVPGRRAVAFSGWIELADALERVLVATPPRRAGPPGLSADGPRD